ncbi:MAG: TatD family hydrolase [Planctomycetota bacterium]
MIDTHCHLTDPRLHGQLDDVLRRAVEAGVDRVVSIGTGLDDDLSTIQLAERHDGVFAVVGVHPHYAANDPVDPTPRLRELQAHPKVVALGEMGLEYHWDDTPRDVQQRSFEHQLALAAELGRPVVIHSREAIDDTLAILANEPGVECVFHCFTGTPAEVDRVVAAGHLVGFTGALTFKKNDDLRTACQRVPLDRLLVETDGPYLSPEPLRKQKTCEPAFVIHTAKCIAALHGKTLEEIDAVTTANAERFYRLPNVGS